MRGSSARSLAFGSISSSRGPGAPVLLQKDHLETFFSGSWGWFALLVLVNFLAPWVEELFFRGLMLPRVRKVFGRIDWVVNGAIFGLYHLHQPWSMPAGPRDRGARTAPATRRESSGGPQEDVSPLTLGIFQSVVL
jgi:membrane protease YdiL (CAAX protease family)